jgi:hypothetical protein
LEHFENKILTAKEIRRKELLEERRQVLTQAFENDLKTYQTLVSYQGAHAASRGTVCTHSLYYTTFTQYLHKTVY